MQTFDVSNDKRDGIVAPPPVVITRTPLDQVKSKLPFGGGDKKK